MIKICIFIFVIINYTCLSQTIEYLNESDYNYKKSNGTLQAFEQLGYDINGVALKDISLINSSFRSQKASGCNGYVENIGAPYQILWNKDDGSAPVINLPFNFCFFGDSYNSVYMNNNGNISFVSSNSSFNATAFPSNINKILAGFWADFDFGACGTMHSIITSSSAIFSWVDAGYFDDECDKKNTFQIIITDGVDPLIAGGNVAIHYKDMNWTTGNASNGLNGYGGIPASCGANRGNNLDYFQIGFFDHAGLDYNGPNGANAGIDWLDNRSFYFDFCNVVNGNMAPIPIISDNCESYKICSKGDTLKLSFPFLSPENNQITSVSYSSTTLNNIQVISNNSGINGEITLLISGDDQIIGTHDLTLIGTDNATPPASTSITYQVEIFNFDNVIPIIPTLLYQTSCPPVAITLTDTSFTHFNWSTGSTIFTDTIHSSINDTISVLIERQGCKVLVDSLLYVPAVPIFNFSGDFVYCSSQFYTNISLVDSLFLDSVDWQTTINNTSNNNFNANLSIGEYPIQIWDSTGFCANDTIIEISQFEPLDLVSLIITCDSNSLISNNTGGSNIGSWSTSFFPNSVTYFNLDSLNTPFLVSNFGHYQLIYIDSFCSISDSIELIYSDKPNFNITIIDPICKNTFYDVSLIDSLNMNQISWNFPTDTLNSIFQHSYSSGFYTLRLENQYGCFKDTILSILEYPTVQLNHALKICSDSVVLDQNIGLDVGLWSFYNSDGNATFTNIDSLSTTIKVSEFGNYNLVYTDSICQNKDTLSLLFIPNPKGSILDSSVCNGVYQNIYMIDSFPSFTGFVNWNTGESTPSIIAYEDGNYTIEISNFCGNFTDTSFIYLLHCEIEIPNTFSPNKDGQNDFFHLNSIDIDFNEFNFSIINRWGEEIISFQDPYFKWDGLDKLNNKMIDGVYFYKLDFVTSKSLHQTKTGFFHILR